MQRQCSLYIVFGFQLKPQSGIDVDFDQNVLASIFVSCVIWPIRFETVGLLSIGKMEPLTLCNNVLTSLYHFITIVQNYTVLIRQQNSHSVRTIHIISNQRIINQNLVFCAVGSKPCLKRTVMSQFSF